MTHNTNEEQNVNQAQSLEEAREQYMREAEQEVKPTRTRRRDRLKAMMSLAPSKELLNEDFAVVITYIDGITKTETHTSGIVSSWAQAGTLADKTMRQTNGTLISITPYTKD